jgi:SNF2 family DNA or RNA helicase
MRPRSNQPSNEEVTVQFTNTRDGEDSDSKRNYHEISDSDDTRPRSRNLIENIYDVEQRRHEFQPAKKMKMDGTVTPGNMTSKPATPADNGLGQWMKDGESKPNSTSTSTPTSSDVVDLTADLPKAAEDDDVQVTGSNDLSNQRICYGKLENAMVNAHLVPKPRANPVLGPESLQWSSMKLDLVREARKGDNRIDVKDPFGKLFATVDAKTSIALCPLLDSPALGIDVTARLDMRKKVAGEEVWQPTHGLYRASITIYGPRKHVEKVGNFLGQHNVWLGTPVFVENGVPVFNPHAEQRRAMAAAAAANNGNRPVSNIRYEVRTTEEVTDSVMKMFDKLVSMDIPKLEPPATVVTPLLDHQKQALWFMKEKEAPRKYGDKEEDHNSLWRKIIQNGRTKYQDIISGVICDEEPAQTYGGLLADVMGLGKTLSILSLVLSTLDDATDWARKMPDRHLVRSIPGVRNTRTTLLVVPLSTIANWVSQINEHIKPDSLKYYVFHGASRKTDLDELSELDLLITTYPTIHSEILGRGAKRGSPLAKMNMFRIVLDEAHSIRELGNQQTKAILSLNSQRRWSVTGTPIQNRLEDLLSVTKFLRLFPYDDRARFSHNVISPMKTGNANALASLRVLIDSFTLRRVKKMLDLPERTEKIVTLEFNEKEAQLHEFFRNESNAMMGVIAKESRKTISGRMYHVVLKAMMILRQVSAHGKELLDIEDRERTKGLSVQDAIDLEDSEPDENQDAFDKKALRHVDLMVQSGDTCKICDKLIEVPMTETGAQDKNSPMAIYLPCLCVLCPDCFSPWKTVFDAKPDTEIQCQVCGGWTRLQYSEVTAAGLDRLQIQQKESRKNGKILGEYEGPHTKTLALIENLLSIAAESKTLVGEPPIKAVVFSLWTSHLDLIEIALKQNGLDCFTRLDGTMNLKARSKALDAFAKDNNITILLATIGAGGVGLNLTSASRVFVMEPHYNPAAVAQAVDRVHRLGQHREVVIMQFIMKNSIEEKILELARKKQKLADMSMNRGKLDKGEAQEQRMREYRSLFK